MNDDGLNDYNSNKQWESLVSAAEELLKLRFLLFLSCNLSKKQYHIEKHKILKYFKLSPVKYSQHFI